MQCTRDVVWQLVPDVGIAHLVSSPFLVWYLTSIVGYYTVLFSIYVLGSYYVLGDDSPNARDQLFM